MNFVVDRLMYLSRVHCVYDSETLNNLIRTLQILEKSRSVKVNQLHPTIDLESSEVPVYGWSPEEYVLNGIRCQKQQEIDSEIAQQTFQKLLYIIFGRTFKGIVEDFRIGWRQEFTRMKLTTTGIYV